MRFQMVTNPDGAKIYNLFPEIDEERVIIKTISDCLKSVDTSRVVAKLVQSDDNLDTTGFAIIVE